MYLILKKTCHFGVEMKPHQNHTGLWHWVTITIVSRVFSSFLLSNPQLSLVRLQIVLLVKSHSQW